MNRLLFLLPLVLFALISCSKEEEAPAPPPTPTYKLSFSAEEGGTVSTEGGTYTQGSKITVTATPDGMYLFKEWSDGSTVNPREITVNADLTLKATFVKKTYPLSVTIDGEGTVQEQVIIQGSTTETQYNAGTTVRLTATANEGWEFSLWVVDGEVITENPIEVTIEKGREATVFFKRTQFELNITIEGEGTVKEEVIIQPSQYDFETVVRLTAVPADGYVFSGWSGDVTSEDNPIEVEVKNEINIMATFSKTIVFFQDRSPNYPPVNYSSSSVRTNKYFPPFNPDAKFIYSKINKTINANCTDCGLGCNGPNFYYLNGDNSFVYLDYDNDNKLDLFGFLMNGDGYGINKGIYFLINDVFNDFQISYIDSDHYFAVRLELNDFNGDGNEDVLIYHSDDHELNTYESMQPFSIAYFDPNGISRISSVGNKTSAHTVVAFDVDQDGDVDILNFEKYAHDESKYSFNFGQTHQELPLLYRNDGTGIFTEEDNFIQFDKNLLENSDFRVDGSGVFDLDGDGYLDLVVGYEDSQTLEIIKGMTIYWGSSTYSYSYENSTKLTIADWNTDGRTWVWGVSFIDYDQDGLYDIITTGIAQTKRMTGTQELLTAGGNLSLHKNVGNRQFKNVTTEVIDKYYWTGRENHGDYIDIPFAYKLKIIDYDGDGDFDIAPHGGIIGAVLEPRFNGEWSWEDASGSNIWWENVNGRFIFHHDKIDLFTGCLK